MHKCEQTERIGNGRNDLIFQKYYINKLRVKDWTDFSIHINHAHVINYPPPHWHTHDENEPSNCMLNKNTSYMVSLTMNGVFYTSQASLIRLYEHIVQRLPLIWQSCFSLVALIFYSGGHVKLSKQPQRLDASKWVCEAIVCVCVCVSFHGPTNPPVSLDPAIFSGNAMSRTGMHTHAHTFHIWNNTTP